MGVNSYFMDGEGRYINNIKCCDSFFYIYWCWWCNCLLYERNKGFINYLYNFIFNYICSGDDNSGFGGKGEVKMRKRTKKKIIRWFKDNWKIIAFIILVLLFYFLVFRK